MQKREDERTFLKANPFLLPPHLPGISRDDDTGAASSDSGRMGGKDPALRPRAAAPGSSCSAGLFGAVLASRAALVLCSEAGRWSSWLGHAVLAKPCSV